MGWDFRYGSANALRGHKRSSHGARQGFGLCRIESFGVDRSMFGSDFPVGRLWTTFDAIFDGFKAIVQDFSEDEQRALFHDNARRVYRMESL